MFYNCYEKKSFLDFFSSDCSDVKDRFTIYTKSKSDSLYSVFKQFDLMGKKSSVDSWQLFDLDLTSITNNLYVTFTFFL